MVEAAGIEPASANPLPSGLHAYSVINLTACYPTGRENRQPAQLGFNDQTLNMSSRDPVIDDPRFGRTETNLAEG